MTNQCSKMFTDGEETQKQIEFTVVLIGIVALLYHPIKGKSKSRAFGWLVFTSGSKI